MNLYATGAGARVSAPPHTDAQRVLVLQCHGRKRWRVWRPPDPAAAPGSDPLKRGKGDDVLALGDLDDAPLLDVVLGPGDALYVPAGFPHTTDTLGCALENEPSVHLTLGVDTHIWGLDGLGARAGALALLGEDDALAGREATAVDADFYWSKLRKTLPALGWRGAPQASSDANLGAIAAFLASTDARLAADGGRHCRAVAATLSAHADAVTRAIEALYADVVFHTTRAPAGLHPTKRSAPHFRRLETTMDALLESYQVNAAKSPFAVGDAVLANFLGTDDFFDAVVDRVRVDGTVDVVFDDGDFEAGLGPDRVKPKKKKKKKKKATAPKAAAGMGGGGGGGKKKKKKQQQR